METVLPPIVQTKTWERPKMRDERKASLPPGVTFQKKNSPNLLFMYELRIAAARHNPREHIGQHFALKSSAIRIEKSDPTAVKRQYNEQNIHKQKIMAEHNKTVRNRKAQSMLSMHKEKRLSQRNALRIQN